MRVSHYNQTDSCPPITGLKKCQEGGREGEREGENLDIMKASLLRRAALKIIPKIADTTLHCKAQGQHMHFNRTTLIFFQKIFQIQIW
jgi:hypothetical protein